MSRFEINFDHAANTDLDSFHIDINLLNHVVFLKQRRHKRCTVQSEGGSSGTGAAN